MRKWFLLFVCLVSSLAYGQAVYTAVAGTNNWHTTASWTHTGTPSCSTAYPCGQGDANYVSGGGDTAIIPSTSHIVCESSQTCIIGNSPTTDADVLTMTGTGTLELASSSTFVYQGRVTLTCCSFTVGDSVGIWADSSHSTIVGGVQYTFRTRSTGTGAGTVTTVNGTCPSRGANGICTGGVTWTGESFGKSWASTTSCAGSTNCCTSAATCQAGSIGSISFTAGDDGFQGTVHNLHISNVQGTTSGSNQDAIDLYIVANTTLYDGLTLDSSGRLQLTVNNSSSGQFHCNHCSITNTTNPNASPQGITITGNTTSNTGTYGFSNSDIAERLAFPSPVADTSWSFYDNMFETSLGGSTQTANLGAGYGSVTNSGAHDGNFFYNNGSNPGTSVNGNRVATTPVYNFTRNTLYAELAGQLATSQPASFNSFFSNGPTGTSLQFTDTDNAGGSMGSEGNLGSQSSVNGAAPGTTPTYLNARNVTMTGYDGEASGNGYHGNHGAGTAVSNIQATYTGNSYFTENGTCCRNRGSIASESACASGAQIASINSSIFGNNQASTTLVGAICTNATNCTTQYTNEFANNTAVNSSSNTTMYCATNNGTTQAPTATNSNFQTGTMDSVMDQPVRAVPLFDTLYAIPAALLPGSTLGEDPTTYWSGQTGWQGKWVSGTVYTAGQIVCVSGGAGTCNVTGYSGVYENLPTFWRCRTGHTAGTTNQPILASDTSNPYQNSVLYWEPAWIQWARSSVLQGTAFQDGSIGMQSAHTCASQTLPANCTQTGYIVVDNTDCGMGCMLSKWIINGHRTRVPAFWGTGKNGVDRGIPAAPIVHQIPKSGSAT